MQIHLFRTVDNDRIAQEGVKSNEVRKFKGYQGFTRGMTVLFVVTFFHMTGDDPTNNVYRNFSQWI